ncbi:hypothetical protein SAMN04487866_12215 [Thermoactinomyces sp. DSM 45891]|uniref:hypothetical protein n=1 Tax=Thermoactinomyces sp. DSM 45891 TaxID=1761907 RepID=UPI0009248E44|nr:hypothetical protein [Thermoactinomyces sp. DSM 45891]SFX74748.1 hypothetical protein SAMN04487866_12215 [Thermoactinomyces sp. DSM 45891]
MIMEIIGILVKVFLAIFAILFTLVVVVLGVLAGVDTIADLKERRRRKELIFAILLLPFCLITLMGIVFMFVNPSLSGLMFLGLTGQGILFVGMKKLYGWT